MMMMMMREKVGFIENTAMRHRWGATPSERQARVLAEAQKYRAALTAATQKLVSFKKAASARLVGWSMPPCCIHMRGRVIGQDAFSPNVWFSDLNYKQVAVFDCGPGRSCVSLVLDRLTAGLRLKSHSCTS
jgi:hypothetical protein